MLVQNELGRNNVGRAAARPGRHHRRQGTLARSSTSSSPEQVRARVAAWHAVHASRGAGFRRPRLGRRPLLAARQDPLAQ